MKPVYSDIQPCSVFVIHLWPWREISKIIHSTVTKLMWYVKYSGNMATTSSDSRMSVVARIASISLGFSSTPLFFYIGPCSIFCAGKTLKTAFFHLSLLSTPQKHLLHGLFQLWRLVVPKRYLISKSLPSWNLTVSFRNARKTSKLISIMILS